MGSWTQEAPPVNVRTHDVVNLCEEISNLDSTQEFLILTKMDIRWIVSNNQISDKYFKHTSHRYQNQWSTQSVRKNGSIYTCPANRGCIHPKKCATLIEEPKIDLKELYLEMQVAERWLRRWALGPAPQVPKFWFLILITIFGVIGDLRSLSAYY